MVKRIPDNSVAEHETFQAYNITASRSFDLLMPSKSNYNSSYRFLFNFCTPKYYTLDYMFTILPLLYVLKNTCSRVISQNSLFNSGITLINNIQRT